MVNALSKFAQECRESWDEHEQLAEVVYSYTTAVQESTRHTPFVVMFGRKANLPIDFNAAATYDPDEKLTEFLQVVNVYNDFVILYIILLPILLVLQAQEGDPDAQEEQRRNVESEVKSNVENAQKKQKLHYDQKHAAGDLFTVGSLVLKKDFRRKRRRGGKMDYRWQGPFTITTVLGRGLYSLKERGGKKVI